MLTSRGLWILAMVLGLLFLGLLTATASLVLVCLTLLSWILGSWLVFAVKMRLIHGRLRVEREMRGPRGPLRILWVGQQARVVVRLVCDSKVSLPSVWIVDRLPALGRLQEGTNKAQGSVDREQPLEIDYSVTCPGAGHLRFEGLHVQIADLHGFFQQAVFVRQVGSYRIYPAVALVRGHWARSKQHNVLPLLGTHRHRRPGSGSELLDLRDYLPGDPPKMIAWKASARRDRLMTKEFESEVPVRCTLFVDLSSSVRIGRVGENVLSRLIDIAAGVVQASVGAKDLTGVCLFDENKIHKLIRPGRGSRHIQNVLRALTDVADLPAESDHVSLDQLLQLAFGLAQEVYPDLLDPAVNAFPPWLPFWAPQPGYTQEFLPRPSGSPWNIPRAWLRYQSLKQLYLLREFLLGRLSPRKRRNYRWRKLLAAILAERYEMGPGGLSRLLEDDLLCRQLLQRFLSQHQVAFPVPLYDGRGRYLLAAPDKIDLLVRTLLACVTRGRDNELFVLLVDVLEVGPKLDALLRAVRVARARHHRVIMICPWPAGVSLPGSADIPPAEGTDRPPDLAATSEISRLGLRVAGLSMQALFFQASSDRLRQAGRRVKHAFARMGVPVLFSPEEESVELILHHMQQLRLLERGGP
jgi:uncharacterized protein (DUF58 family)